MFGTLLKNNSFFLESPWQLIPSPNLKQLQSLLHTGLECFQLMGNSPPPFGKSLSFLSRIARSPNPSILTMKPLPLINRNSISRHLLITRHLQAMLRHSGTSEKLTDPLWWQVTATQGSRSLNQPAQETCTKDPAKESWCHAEQATGAGLSQAQDTVGRNCPGLNFTQSHPTNCWVNLAMSLKLFGLYFYTLLEMGLRLSLLSPQEHGEHQSRKQRSGLSTLVSNKEDQEWISGWAPMRWAR